MRKGLVTHFRVIFALILREARVRHGRSRFGYAWAIIEPAALIVLLTTLFSQLRTGPGGSVDFATFFATGVLPFQMFRSTSQYVSMSMEANRPLFNYLPVKPIDAVIARTVLELCTMLVVMVLVYSFQVFAFGAVPPQDYGGLLLVFSVIAVMSFGAGLCLAVGRRFMAALPSVYAVVMGAAFFLSCVFYSLSAVPTHLRDILWLNPLVHLVEGFRAAYLGGYRIPDVDLIYPFVFGVTLIFLGLLVEPMTKKQLEA